jgi:hypothetical protein
MGGQKDGEDSNIGWRNSAYNTMADLTLKGCQCYNPCLYQTFSVIEIRLRDRARVMNNTRDELFVRL